MFNQIIKNMNKREKLLRDIIDATKKKRKFQRWGNITLRTSAPNASWISVCGQEMMIYGHGLPYHESFCFMLDNHFYSFDEYTDEFCHHFFEKVDSIRRSHINVNKDRWMLNTDMKIAHRMVLNSPIVYSQIFE